MSKKFYEWVGWGGVALAVLEYVAISLGGVNPVTVGYQLLVLLCSVAMTVIGVKQKAWQSVVINVLFMLISVVTILKVLVFGV